MNVFKTTIVTFFGFGLLLTGCATTPSSPYVPTDEPGITTAGVDAYDVRLIVETMMRQARNEWQSEASHLGRLPIIAYTGINTRGTPVPVHNDEIIALLSREILNSGLATFSTAFSPDRKGGWSGHTYDLIDASDPTINPYIDPTTAPAPRGIQAPDYQLHGRVTGYREIRRRNLTEVNFTVALTLSNVRTGVMVFQGVHQARKNIRQ